MYRLNNTLHYMPVTKPSIVSIYKGRYVCAGIC